MKTIIYFCVFSLAVSATHKAEADVTIRICGSSSFRSAVHRSIIAMMGGAPNVKIAHSNSIGAQESVEQADFATFQGAASGISGTTSVQCSWTGSGAGIETVANNTNALFIPLTALPSVNGYGNSNSGEYPTQSATAKFAMSDVFQSSTQTTSPSLSELTVAVIPYVWVANRGATGLDSITCQSARALLTNGFQPMYLFNGDANDTAYVLPVGRDKNSGARISTLAETKFGINTPLQHWKIVTSGDPGTGMVSSAQIWPTTGVGSDPMLAGNGGYTSSKTLSLLMGYSSDEIDLLDGTGENVEPDVEAILVACLGAADAGIATNGINQAIRLSYNGVEYDDTSGPGKVYTGRYTMWGYEHLYNSGGLSADESTFRSNLEGQLDVSANLGNAGLRCSLMLVGRSGDGAVVGP